MDEQDGRNLFTASCHASIGLFPLQVLKLGLVALICTGMFAAVDWIYQHSVHIDHGATQANRTTAPDIERTPASAPNPGNPNPVLPSPAESRSNASANAALETEAPIDTGAANTGVSV